MSKLTEFEAVRENVEWWAVLGYPEENLGTLVKLKPGSPYKPKFSRHSSVGQVDLRCWVCGVDIVGNHPHRIGTFYPSCRTIILCCDTPIRCRDRAQVRAFREAVSQ